MKKYISLLVIVAAIGIIACSNTASATSGETLQLIGNSTFHPHTIKDSKIKITIDGKSFVFKLANNKTAAALQEIAPFETTATVYHDNHYYGSIPKSLSIDGPSFVKIAKKGQLVYSAEYKGLGLFFEDGRFEDNDFVVIGEVDGDISTLKASKGQVKMKIDIAVKGEKILNQ